MSLIYSKNMGSTLGLTVKYTFREEILAKENFSGIYFYNMQPKLPNFFP